MVIERGHWSGTTSRRKIHRETWEKRGQHLTRVRRRKKGKKIVNFINKKRSIFIYLFVYLLRKKKVLN